MKVRVALAQVSVDKDIESNIRKGIDFLEKASNQGADIICYPEMSFYPFFPQYQGERQYFSLAETIPGPLVKRFSQACKKNRIAAIINLYEKMEGGQYFDCSPVIDKNGELIGKSQMMHIAELPNYNEKYYYWEGKTGYPVYNINGFKFGIAICYDRHYPEQIRALTLKGAQVIFVPTATSLSELKNVWEVEMQAASATNQIFIAVANHVGRDDKIQFFGKSFVTDPKGDIMSMAGDSEDELLIADLDLDEIEKTRQLLPFLRDRRPETYSELLHNL